jgi:hypothetical protein
MSSAFSLRSCTFVLLLYLLLALALTWPVATTMATRVPGDLGDPLLNMWILAWDFDHLTRFASGEYGALRGFWNTNIFYPTPLTLAYSEHLLPLAVQALPVYVLSHSLVLCYNLLFLSTFVLSALGAYLLARALMQSAPAAFVAGIFYGFALYRLVHLGHLQVLSSQWMPFALLGLWRFAETRRVLPLTGAALALLAQGLSCGYYLFFFSPFAAAFAVWALWRHQRLKDVACWRGLILAALGVVLAALPFLLPYAKVRATGVIARTPQEIALYSADIAGCLRVDRSLRLWGPFHRNATAPNEGDLFPGLVPSILAVLGFALAIRAGRLRAASARWRVALGQPAVAFMVAALAATTLAFGPTIRFAGHAVLPGPYALLSRVLPGLDSLRVPARFAMLVALFVALAAAEGARALASRRRALLLLSCLALFLVECTPVPLRTNQILRDRGWRKQPPLELPAPAIYADVARLPKEAVLIELPIGAPAHDVRAVFYSTTHWRALVNGYSGAQPRDYSARAAALRDAPTRPEVAWAVLLASQATHVLNHEDAWPRPLGRPVSEWLTAHGARRVASVGSDVLFGLPVDGRKTDPRLDSPNPDSGCRQ